MWDVNPRVAIPPAIFAVVDLWLACRAGPKGALPTGGAVGEQPAALMDAFVILDGAGTG